MTLKSYVVSVIFASVIVGISLNLFKTKNAYGVITKLIAGLFIALTIISPWKRFHISDILYYFDEWEKEFATNANYNTDTYNVALRTSITEQTQAYILEKASSIGAELTATVILSHEQPPVPVAVELAGNISPYNKIRMQEIIVNDLGIPEDAQIWK